MASGPHEPRWPPRSPHEALLSSPTGRTKLRQYHDRTSPSPSPLKKSATTPNLRRVGQGSGSGSAGDEEEDEEDEETLQLQLQALEAKLKLKRLQQKKSKAATSSSDAENGCQRSTTKSRKENVPPLSQRGSDLENRTARLDVSRDLQIPVSPPRRPASTAEARSPGRVLLGIDKGLKGKNISLRRPTTGQSQNEDPFLSIVTPSTKSTNATLPRDLAVPSFDDAKRPKSFSERIAETRQQDKARRQRDTELYRQRSTGFGIPQKDIEAMKNAADEVKPNKVSQPGRSTPALGGEFSRDEVLAALNKPDQGTIRRSKTVSGIRQWGDSSQDIWRNPNAEPEVPTFVRPPSDTSKQRVRSNSPRPKSSEKPSRETSPSTSESLFEPFSSIHLSKRLLPHDLLTRTFSQKSMLLLPSLLSTVKSPDYSLPDSLSADYVVLAIVASKSNPLIHKNTQKSNPNPKGSSTSLTEAVTSSQNTNGKYMVLTLTDLKWTLDLFLFTTAYTRFWKLTPGTVVALLNPNIMPPPPAKADTGRFSLTLNSSDDTILEIGTSRDLGWCKAVRKDGKSCTDWIDKRHTEVCEYHVDRQIEKTRRGRMEVQGMSAPFAPGGRKKGRTGHFGGGGGVGNGPTSRDRTNIPLKDQVDGFAPEGARYDRGSSTRYFIAPRIPGSSAAELLDAEGSMLTSRGESKEERVRKRLAERERENEIARRLGEGGNGAGSEYLLLRQARLGEGRSSTVSRPTTAEGDADADERRRQLLGRTKSAGDVLLSPVKKRKVGLLSAIEGPQARKKTRFVTERGIKEAGRESLGGQVGIEGEGMEDDDGLEIE